MDLVPKTLTKDLNYVLCLGFLITIKLSRFASEKKNDFLKFVLFIKWSTSGEHYCGITFPFFRDDLPSKCECLFPLMFADDAKFISIGIEHNLVQKALNALLKWIETNHMPFNMDDCAHVSIKINEQDFFLEIT